MESTKCTCTSLGGSCTCPWDGEKVWKKKASLSWASFLARNVFYRKWFEENDKDDLPSSHAGPLRPPPSPLFPDAVVGENNGATTCLVGGMPLN